MNNLINSLVNDLAPVKPMRSLSFTLLTAVSVLAAVALIIASLGMRGDFWTSLQSLPLMWKTLTCLALSILLSFLVLNNSRPGGLPASRYVFLLGGLLLLLWIPGILAFLGDGGRFLSGVSPMACLSFITLAGLLPLSAFLVWLKRAAPTRPIRAGALAGCAAGAIGAFAFANHCPHQEYEYISLYYSLPSLWLAGIGAAAARFLCKW
jgi:hypothetical protein